MVSIVQYEVSAATHSTDMMYKAATVAAASNLQSIATDASQSSVNIEGASETATTLDVALVDKAPSAITGSPINSNVTPALFRSSPNKYLVKEKSKEMRKKIKNAREKGRACQLVHQIDELRNMLYSLGWIDETATNTKCYVLERTLRYIQTLQQEINQIELERNYLTQQIHAIGGVAHEPETANAICYAARNEIHDEISMYAALTRPQHQQQISLTCRANDQNKESQQNAHHISIPTMPTNIKELDYHLIFDSSLVGMAVTSMSGPIIDCNLLFTQAFQCTKKDICSMTLFDLICSTDLKYAFEYLRQMISLPKDATNAMTLPRYVIRASTKTGVNIGLDVSLIKGNDGITKFFCVALIKNPMAAIR